MVRTCGSDDHQRFLTVVYDSDDIEVYYYREKDIFLMTDIESNKDTEMWPSAQNIVRSPVPLMII